VLWIGHFDLTNFLGIPGQFAHPRFIAAIDRVLDACRSHGVAPAILVSDDAAARRFGERGFRMMAYGIDHLMLQEAMRRSIACLREVTRGSAP
jgi:2-keto-3-deoxy-L-rhamnonate aldolase RhmA